MFCRYFIWIVNNFTTEPFDSDSVSFAPVPFVKFVSVNFSLLSFSVSLIYTLLFIVEFLVPLLEYNCCANTISNHRFVFGFQLQQHSSSFFFALLFAGWRKGSARVLVRFECEFNGNSHNITTKQPTWALLRNIIAQQLCWCAPTRGFSSLCLPETHIHTRYENDIARSRATHAQYRMISARHIKLKYELCVLQMICFRFVWLTIFFFFFTLSTMLFESFGEKFIRIYGPILYMRHWTSRTIFGVLFSQI